MLSDKTAMVGSYKLGLGRQAFHASHAVAEKVKGADIRAASNLCYVPKLLARPCKIPVDKSISGVLGKLGLQASENNYRQKFSEGTARHRVLSGL